MSQDEIPYGSNNGKYVTVFDTQIYYEEYGKGTPLLLLHGGGGAMAHFRMVIPELSKHFKVIAVDSPGHGRSEQADSLSYQLMADYFTKMNDIMRLDSVYLMGYSDGAIAGMLVSHDRPDKIKRFVFGSGLLNTASYKPGSLEGIKNITPETRSERWIKEYKSKSPQPEKWEKFVVDFKEMWLQDVYVPNSKLSEIKCRTLVLLGDRDYYIPIEVGIGIYNAISNSELCIMPNTTHGIFYKPDYINCIVRDFLLKD
jgi:pimeloyl-ACP methyl ester carboxylesterase